MTQKLTKILLLAMLTASTSALARDVLEIQGMSVKGNAEQPKVLYLVPWQATSNPQDIEHPPVDKIDGAVTFLEPEIFQKQLYFRRNLKVNVEPMPKN
jgi:hypothetical protein